MRKILNVYIMIIYNIFILSIIGIHQFIQGADVLLYGIMQKLMSLYYIITIFAIVNYICLQLYILVTVIRMKSQRVDLGDCINDKLVGTYSCITCEQYNIEKQGKTYYYYHAPIHNKQYSKSCIIDGVIYNVADICVDSSLMSKVPYELLKQEQYKTILYAFESDAVLYNHINSCMGVVQVDKNILRLEKYDVFDANSVNAYVKYTKAGVNIYVVAKLNRLYSIMQKQQEERTGIQNWFYLLCSVNVSVLLQVLHIVGVLSGSVVIHSIAVIIGVIYGLVVNYATFIKYKIKQYMYILGGNNGMQ